MAETVAKRLCKSQFPNLGGFDVLRFCVLLAKVDLLVPLAPDLGGREHATGTALVTEGGLTGTVSTTTRDTRDTGDSAT
jgi:hypothetical protein